MEGSRSIIRYPIRRILRDGLHRQAAAGATWNLTGTVVARLVALAATVAVVRILGPTRFGGLALVQSTAAAIATLSGLGLAFATTRFVSENLGTDRRRGGRYLTTAAILCVVSGTLFGLIVLALSPQIATDIMGKAALKTPLACSSPLVLLSPLADVLIGGIVGLQQFKSLGWVQGARGTLDGVLLVVGAMAGGIVGGILGYVVAEALACVIAGIWLRRAARAEATHLRWELDRTILPGLMRFAVPSLSTALLFTLSLWLGQIFLVHQPGGLNSVGVFAFAQRFYLAALFLPQVIGTVLFPMLASLSASGRYSRFRRLLGAYIAVICLLATVAAIGLFLFAGVIAALKGRSGANEARTLGVLAFVAIPSALNNALGQAAVALRRIGWWLFSDIILAVALLAAAWILVPSRGSVGLALAYLVGYTATCLAILPAFLKLPGDLPVRADASPDTLEEVDWDVVLPTVGIADALPQIPRPVSQPDSFVAPNQRPHGSRQRIRLATPQARRSLAAPAILLAAFLAVLLWSDTQDFANLSTYPILAVGPALFFVVQLVSPRSRLRVDTPLCPANWGWLLFAVQLILQPSLIILFGPAHGQLFALPTAWNVELSFLLSCLAYVAYAVGLTFVLRKPPITRPIGRSLDDISPGAVVAFISIGVAALFWRFHSLGQLFSYFSGGYGGQESANSAPTTLTSAASTFLRPLGAYGFILLWARSAESTRVHRLRFVLAGLGALAILATYNYNRAAVVIPLISLAAAYGRHIRKLRARSVLGFGLAILLLAVAFGNYRTVVEGTQGGQISRQQAGITTMPSFESELQLYGAAPQFSAVVVQDLSSVGGFANGRTLIDSAMSPIPGLGRSFRSNSGTVRYNAMVYGHAGTVDQVLPFLGELYWNFGPVGVALGFLLVGMTIAAFQRRFDASGGILAAFIFQYFGMWSAFLIIGSLQVVAQIFIYFSLPIVALLLAPKIRPRRAADARPQVASLEQRPS